MRILLGKENEYFRLREFRSKIAQRGLALGSHCICTGIKETSRKLLFSKIAILSRFIGFTRPPAGGPASSAKKLGPFDGPMGGSNSHALYPERTAEKDQRGFIALFLPHR
jgi:hypothetical protein